MAKVKELIKTELKKKKDASYFKTIREKDISFDEWIREEEHNLERFDMTLDLKESDTALGNDVFSYAARIDGVTLRIIPYEKIGHNFNVKNYFEDILVFVNGELTDRALPLIVNAMRLRPDISVVYGDEDIARLDLSESDKYGRSIYGTRENPYFKPDWSPNAFLDHFYFCNVFAVRRVCFRDVSFNHNLSTEEALYEILLRFIFHSGDNLNSVFHIDEILVHSRNYDNARIKSDSARIIASRFVVPKLKAQDEVLLSVIIPSKNNSGLLETCISSLYEKRHDGIKLDIIVVDNGSNEEEVNKIKSLSLKYPFRYEYIPMEFNFASMCNHGAGLARGELLLFLNDDVTVTEDDSLCKMVRVAALNFTGAVGVKLLYPETTKIQHAGVVNVRIGPVHKLQFLDDELDYYHGFNRMVQNVLSVTGACLMVRKDAFTEVGCMNETLRIAFNDMDLCYKLFEAGYKNVVMNNISMTHAESVTRGKDTDKDSLKRLEAEKENLFSLHPAFRFKDPFYSKYLSRDCLDVRIVPGNEYEFSRVYEYAENLKNVDLKAFREEPCVQLSVEYAGPVDKFTDTENQDKKELLVQGFSFVSGSDNALYKKSILLRSEIGTIKIPIKGCLRKDVALSLPDQENVAMSGFSVKIRSGSLKPDSYLVGILYENVFAREKLFVFSNKYLVVK